MLTDKLDHRQFKIFFYLILLLGIALRIFGLNWDQSQHLHPDERFLTMVTTAIKMPPGLANYFNTGKSTLNPHNHNFNFYVYGTFPLLITRMVTELLNATDYGRIFLVGRLLSAFFDTGTLLLTGFLACLLFRQKAIGLWAAFFYAIAVFPVQQAHFFTVDSFTVFFSTLTLLLTVLFLEKKSLTRLASAGFFFGLSLANKTSVGITLPIFLLVISLAQSRPKKTGEWRQFLTTAASRILLFGLSSFLAFRIFQPYAFTGLFALSPRFRQNISDAHKMITGEIDYPPNIQWTHTRPLLHPLFNLFFFGLGPAFSFLSLTGIVILGKTKEKKLLPLFLLIAFALIVFFYQGIQLAKYMRYFYPLYPLLAILAGLASHQLATVKQKRFFVLGMSLSFLSFIWIVSFLSLYTRPHSRVTASEWIYQQIPAGAVLTCEEWDDALPLPLPGFTKNYQILSLALYAPETMIKWQKITRQLAQADYIILSSNRLWESIPRLPQRYPVTTLYYQLLFDGSLGFKKVAQFSSPPCLRVRQSTLWCWPEDKAEESFTVYDHPKVIIFKKTDFNEKMLLPLLDQSLIQKASSLNPKETNKLF